MMHFILICFIVFEKVFISPVRTVQAPRAEGQLHQIIKLSQGQAKIQNWVTGF